MRLVLALLALASPLLTVLRLMQLKEWRMHRLREHLEKEGIVGQLFGWSRIAVTSLWLLLAAAVLTWTQDPAREAARLSMLLLTLLVAVSAIQVGSRRQRMPVWTAKALMVLFTSALPALLIGLVLEWTPDTDPLLIILIPLLAPLWALVGWCLVFPLDALMKRRVLRKAEALRVAHPHLTVIGITGSVGKTTMKELLSHLLKSKDALSTPAHVNSEIGVANWLIRVLKNEPADSSRILIVEMGAYRMGEIALLCRIAKPKIGIITYVGTQHLSLFGSRDNIVSAKGELFASLPEDGTAYANADNDVCEKLVARAACNVVTVGTGHADIQASDIEESDRGTTFKALDTVFRSPLAGSHTVVGVLTAVAVARSLGITPAASAQSLSAFKPLERTFQIKDVAGVTVLDDTYNSSPDSVSAAIRWAAMRPEKKKILILEGIIELGEEEEMIHRGIAEEAKTVFDEVYVAHARYLPYFADTFGEKAKLALQGGPPSNGSLLVLCGRLSPSVVTRFLPS